MSINNVMDYTKDAEEKFCNYFSSKNAFFTRSGTESVMCALLAIDIKLGDEIVVPVSICQSVINAIILMRGIPVFVDIDNCYGLSQEETKKVINAKTKAIIFFHPFGIALDISWLVEMQHVSEYCFYIIEDCAQSLGAKSLNEHIGHQGDLSVFSFTKNKPLSIGLGGMICVNNELLIEQVLYSCRSGSGKYKDTFRLGLNTMLNVETINVFMKKLARFDEILCDKIRKAETYYEYLNEYGNILKFSYNCKDNVYNRVIMSFHKINSQNFDVFYDAIRSKTNLIQNAVSPAPFQVEYVKNYMKEMKRIDLINQSKNQFSKWEELKQKNFFLRTDDSIKNIEITKSCFSIIEEIDNIK